MTDSPSLPQSLEACLLSWIVALRNSPEAFTKEVDRVIAGIKQDIKSNEGLLHAISQSGIDESKPIVFPGITTTPTEIKNFLYYARTLLELYTKQRDTYHTTLLSGLTDILSRVVRGQENPILIRDEANDLLQKAKEFYTLQTGFTNSSQMPDEVPDFLKFNLGDNEADFYQKNLIATAFFAFVIIATLELNKNATGQAIDISSLWVTAAYFIAYLSLTLGKLHLFDDKDGLDNNKDEDAIKFLSPNFWDVVNDDLATFSLNAPATTLRILLAGISELLGNLKDGSIGAVFNDLLHYLNVQQRANSFTPDEILIGSLPSMVHKRVHNIEELIERLKAQLPDEILANIYPEQNPDALAAAVTDNGQSRYRRSSL